MIYIDGANVTARQNKSIGQRKGNLKLETTSDNTEPGCERRGQRFLDRLIEKDVELRKLLAIGMQCAETREDFEGEMKDETYKRGMTA